MMLVATLLLFHIAEIIYQGHTRLLKFLMEQFIMVTGLFLNHQVDRLMVILVSFITKSFSTDHITKEVLIDIIMAG